MSLALAMAGRYLWGGRNRYARFVAWMSLVGLALGVLVLTVVVSVMNGLDAELRSRILGAVPHVLATPGGHPLAEKLNARDDVRSAYGFFSASGMVAGSGAVVPVSLFGVDPENAALLTQVDANMLSGSLGEALAQPGALVLGWPIARHLALAEGDAVMFVAPESTAGSVRPRLKKFRLAGAFAVGAEIDHYLALASRHSFSEHERRLLGMDGVRVDLADPMNVDSFAEELRRLHPDLRLETWKENYGELFLAVAIEKALMFVLLLLVVAIAGFNIVSGQTVLVNDKRADIAMLRTLGADGRFVARVFLWQGVGMATLGILFGLAIGAVVAQNIGELVGAFETWFGFRLLAGSYLVVLPSLVLIEDLLFIGLLSWLLCLLAAWIPARRAARQNPVAGLHV